jgi:hypothetical protein
VQVQARTAWPRTRLSWLARAAHPLPGEADRVFDLFPAVGIILFPQPAGVGLDRRPALTPERLVARQAVAIAEGGAVPLIGETAASHALRVVGVTSRNGFPVVIEKFLALRYEALRYKQL